MSTNSDSNDVQSTTGRSQAQKGTKRASESDVNVDAVHSSNDWEHADLGSEQRNQKFLRLMGASKSEQKGHKSKFVIGDHKPTHSRSAAEEAQLRHNLEDEYECGVEHTIVGETPNSTGHCGLGFHAASTSSDDSSKSSRKEDDQVDSTVKSTNDWEHANLGDQNRRDKFLRLMGANKTEHHGRFVIGDQQPKHSQSGERIEKISHDLEEQFVTSMEARVTGKARSHTGLGYTGVPGSVQLNAADSTSGSTDGGSKCTVSFVKGSSG